MNEKHAVVMIEGKTYVLNKEYDPIAEKRVLTFSNFTDFKNRYFNKYSNIDGSNVSLAQSWLKSTNRKTYNGLIFDPKTPVSMEVPVKKYTDGFSLLIKTSSFTNLDGFKTFGIATEA